MDRERELCTKAPHFRFWSLISISECHVCAKGGSGPLTGPCSVGKEATRGTQNRSRGDRGVAGLASSNPVAARASFMSIFAQDLDPGPRPGTVASRFWTVFPCHVRGNPNRRPQRHPPRVLVSPRSNRRGSPQPRRVQKYKRTLRPTRRAVAEFIYHYHGELSHQGLGNAFVFLDTTRFTHRLYQ